MSEGQSACQSKTFPVGCRTICFQGSGSRDAQGACQDDKPLYKAAVKITDPSRGMARRSKGSREGLDPCSGFIYWRSAVAHANAGAIRMQHRLKVGRKIRTVNGAAAQRRVLNLAARILQP